MAPPNRIGLGGVNCYLAAADRGFVLIDTGQPNKRDALQRELEKAGCWPGDLRLIVLTHGDYDHAGNAAYLRGVYDTQVAMHRDDLARVRRGDWEWGLKAKPDKFALPFRVVSSFIKPGPFDLFEPDICLEDGQHLLRHGYNATVLHLPGHTNGSIGILTAEKDLICGDLMDGLGRPGLQFFINDMTAAKASLGRLRDLGIGTIYPGHGKPFRFERVKEGR